MRAMDPGPSANTPGERVDVERTASARGGLERWLLIDASAGAVVWIVLLALRLQIASGVELIERMFLLAVLVVVPLGLRLSAWPRADGTRSTWFRLACWFHPLAAVAAVYALTIEPGFASGAAAAVWFLFTISVADWGVARFFTRRTLALEELCVDVALLYVVIGGAWFVISRGALRNTGYTPEIIAMTAVHFHFAGFAAPIIAGLAGRWLPERGSARMLWRIGALGVAVGPILVASGIGVSPHVEVVSAFVLAIALTLLSATVAIRAAPRLEAFPAMLVWMCAISLVVTMALACTYALGTFVGTSWISLEWMARTHGIANAFGFALPGLLALTIADPKPQSVRSRFVATGSA
jgi:hypothetical protein